MTILLHTNIAAKHRTILYNGHFTAVKIAKQYELVYFSFYSANDIAKPLYTCTVIGGAMAVCQWQQNTCSIAFCCFLVECVSIPFWPRSSNWWSNNPSQHKSSIPFTYNWIGSFLYLYVRSAQGACEIQDFSFISRHKHISEREGSPKFQSAHE